MMAIWFLSSAWAQYIGGIIAGMTETESVAGSALSNEAALNASLDVFWILGWIGVGIGVLLSLCSFVLKHMAHGAFTEKTPEELAEQAAAASKPAE
jgi:POT family proton-dependent oligopeptide transporter